MSAPTPAPPASATPSVDRVALALRLGWAVSELRGRLRPGEKLTVIEPLPRSLRAEHALPLGGERTVLEQLIEAEAVVCSLAEQLGLLFAAVELTDANGDAERSAADELEELAKALARARARSDQAAESKAWQAMAEFLYAWDARIQDALAGADYDEMGAYQLGRGMGEICWLDPSKASAEESTSWRFVLGERRLAALERLSKRLTPHFQPLTARGVNASLATWGKVAAGPGELASDLELQARLREQTRRWRDLLLADQNAKAFLSRASIVARAAQLRRVILAYWPELSGACISGLLAAGGAAVLAGGKHSASLATFVAVIGGLGLTTSGLLAKAKTEGQAVLEQLRMAFDTDLVVEAVTVEPQGVSQPSATIAAGPR